MTELPNDTSRKTSIASSRLEATRVELTFFRSVTLAVSAAALVLAYADESRWPAIATPFVALFAHNFAGPRPRFYLTVRWANAFGILAFCVATWEFVGENVLAQLLAGGHLLVYMSWIVLLLRKGIRQFWWLAALCVLQVSVASVLSDSPTFGVSVVVMLMIMIWLLSVFSLYRTQVRLVSNAFLLREGDQDEGSVALGHTEDSLNVDADSDIDRQRLLIRHGLQIDSDEPWVGWRFRGVVVFASGASLLLAVVTFTVFPRVWAGELILALDNERTAGLTHRTGYAGNVSLGESGSITPSDRRVLQFEVFRMHDNSTVTPEQFAKAMNMDEILFRGGCLEQYRDGSWHDSRDSEATLEFNTRVSKAAFRVRITQDPPVRDTAFAPLPANNARNVESTGVMKQLCISHSMTHNLKKHRARLEPLSYEIWCPDLANSVSETQNLPGWSATESSSITPGSEISRRRAELRHAIPGKYLHVRYSDGLPHLRRVTRELFNSDAETELPSPADRAKRIVSFLATSGEFSYSLEARIMDKTIDPVEDFLLNRRSGHCEYFASACVLMLQVVDVPARIVSGFKGCEINEVSGRAEVKEKHAHTWVEAYLDGRWETIDPTPAARLETAQSQATGDFWADLRRAFQDGWIGTVQKMSLSRQKELARPVTDGLMAAIDVVRDQGIWAAVKLFIREMLLKPENWFSVQGWLATFVILLAAGLAVRYRVLRCIWGAFTARISWLRPGTRQQRTVVGFYENFRKICQQHGLHLDDHHTAQENAERVRAHFNAALLTPADQCIPLRVATSFNKVRFGREVLTEDTVANVRGDVSRFVLLLADGAPNQN